MFEIDDDGAYITKLLNALKIVDETLYHEICEAVKAQKWKEAHSMMDYMMRKNQHARLLQSFGDGIIFAGCACITVLCKQIGGYNLYAQHVMSSRGLTLMCINPHFNYSNFVDDIRLKELFIYGRAFHLGQILDDREERPVYSDNGRELVYDVSIPWIERIYCQSARRARAAALTVVWMALTSKDVSRKIAFMVWESRFDPAAWNVALSEENNYRVVRWIWKCWKRFMGAFEKTTAHYSL